MSLPIIERATYTIFFPPEHRVIPILSDVKKTRPMKGKFFQSRHIPSVLTMQRRKSTIHNCFSTHVPLTRHDASLTRIISLGASFNPRTPCGARLERTRKSLAYFRFQSTCILRGTTMLPWAAMPALHFNPRAPCEARRTELSLHHHN